MSVASFVKKKDDFVYFCIGLLTKIQEYLNNILIAAKTRANDRIILNSRHQTKALRNIIKNETGKGFMQNQNISLEIDSLLVTNP
jgi:hypothetical protein